MTNTLCRRLSCRMLFAICLSLLAGSLLQAENWPSWRGPRGNGISSEKNLPLEWSRSKNVAWKLPLPGRAGATPAVWGERIFLTSADGNDLLLICAGTNGKELWRTKIGSGEKGVKGDEGNMASPSPVTDGKHVWSFMSTGDLACFTVSGKPVWKLNVQERYGKLKIAFGMSSTPVYHEGRLFLQLIHGDGKAATQEAMVVAVDALTGEEIWKQDRVTAAYNENEHSYASAMLYDFGGQTYLISHGADYTIAHRLSDGSEIWRLEDLNPQKDSNKPYHPTLRFVASPGVSEGLIVVPTAKDHPVFAIRPNGKGSFGVSGKPFVWQYHETPDVPSPLILDGLVYLCMENGNLHCLEAKTGKEVYKNRTHRHRHRASPVYADGHIYLTARDGKVTVVKAGRKFEIVSQNEMEETLTASPVISNGTIYLRTWETLWAIRKK